MTGSHHSSSRHSDPSGANAADQSPPPLTEAAMPPRDPLPETGGVKRTDHRDGYRPARYRGPGRPILSRASTAASGTPFNLAVGLLESRPGHEAERTKRTTKEQELVQNLRKGYEDYLTNKSLKIKVALEEQSASLRAFRDTITLSQKGAISVELVDAATKFGFAHQLFYGESLNSLIGAGIRGVAFEANGIERLLPAIIQALQEKLLDIRVLAKFFELPYQELPQTQLGDLLKALVVWERSSPDSNRKLAVGLVFGILFGRVNEIQESLISHQSNPDISSEDYAAHEKRIAEAMAVTRIAEAAEGQLELGTSQLLSKCFTRVDGKPIENFEKNPSDFRIFILGAFHANGMSDTKAFAALLQKHIDASRRDSLVDTLVNGRYAVYRGLDICPAYNNHLVPRMRARVERELLSDLKNIETEKLAETYLHARLLDWVSEKLQSAVESEIIQRLTRPGRNSGTTSNAALALGELCARDISLSSQCHEAILKRLDEHLRETQSIEEAIGLASLMLAAHSHNRNHCEGVVHQLGNTNRFTDQTLPMYRRAATIMALLLQESTVQLFAEREFSFDLDPTCGEANAWLQVTKDSYSWAQAECQQLENELPERGFIRFHTTGVIEVSYGTQLMLILLPHPHRWGDEGSRMGPCLDMLQVEAELCKALADESWEIVTIREPSAMDHSPRGSSESPPSDSEIAGISQRAQLQRAIRTFFARHQAE